MSQLSRKIRSTKYLFFDQLVNKEVNRVMEEEKGGGHRGGVGRKAGLKGQSFNIVRRPWVLKGQSFNITRRPGVAISKG